MARKPIVFDLLVSCPGDIQDEIEVIHRVVDEFNRYSGTLNNVFIQIRHWSKDAYPQAGSSPQAILNKQLLEKCDAVVSLFWTRFGTPTDNYGSGTEEEINKMIQDKKQVFLYFSDKPISPSLQSNQYNKVKALKKKYKGLYFSYKSDEEFERLFSNHINMYFINLINSSFSFIEKTRFEDYVIRNESFDVLDDYYKYAEIKPVISYGELDALNIVTSSNGFEMVINVNTYKLTGQQEFLMALIEYTPSENWSVFWRANYYIEFDIETSVSISALHIEIKDENRSKIIDKQILTTTSNTHINLFFPDLKKSESWEKVSQICFVIFINKYYISESKGNVRIYNFKLVPSN